MGKHRIDTPDTVDPALHLLQRLQAEGWGLDGLNLVHEYITTDAGRRLPAAAIVTIRLLPASTKHP